MKLISPTGKGVRNDGMGSGSFGARRGARTHLGTDFICDPGQKIFSPISGRIVREAKPYGDCYSGVLIESGQISIKMFYLEPYKNLYGSFVKQGDVIGTAQDISLKYGGGMTPHVHLQVENIDPESLI